MQTRARIEFVMDTERTYFNGLFQPMHQEEIYNILNTKECKIFPELLADIKASPKQEEGLRLLAKRINPVESLMRSLRVHEVSQRETKVGFFWIDVANFTAEEEDRLKKGFASVTARLSLDLLFWTYGKDSLGSMHVLAAIRNHVECDKQTPVELVNSAVLSTIMNGEGRVEFSKEDKARVQSFSVYSSKNAHVALSVLVSSLCHLCLNDQHRMHIEGDECFRIMVEQAHPQFNAYCPDLWKMLVVVPKTPDTGVTFLRSVDRDSLPPNSGKFLQSRSKLFSPTLGELRTYMDYYTPPDVHERESQTIGAMLYSLVVQLNSSSLKTSNGQSQKEVMDALWKLFADSFEKHPAGIHDMVFVFLDEITVQCCMAMTSLTPLEELLERMSTHFDRINATVQTSFKMPSLEKHSMPVKLLAVTPFAPCGRSTLMQALRFDKVYSFQEKARDWTTKPAGNMPKPGYADMLAGRVRADPVLYQQGNIRPYLIFKCRDCPVTLPAQAETQGEAQGVSRGGLASSSMMTRSASVSGAGGGYQKRKAQFIGNQDAAKKGPGAALVVDKDNGGTTSGKARQNQGVSRAASASAAFVAAAGGCKSPPPPPRVTGGKAVARADGNAAGGGGVAPPVQPKPVGEGDRAGPLVQPRPVGAAEAGVAPEAGQAVDLTSHSWDSVQAALKKKVLDQLHGAMIFAGSARHKMERVKAQVERGSSGRDASVVRMDLDAACAELQSALDCLKTVNEKGRSMGVF
jgi:hypothetical protein